MVAARLSQNSGTGTNHDGGAGTTIMAFSVILARYSASLSLD